MEMLVLHFCLPTSSRSLLRLQSSSSSTVAKQPTTTKQADDTEALENPMSLENEREYIYIYGGKRREWERSERGEVQHLIDETSEKSRVRVVRDIVLLLPEKERKVKGKTLTFAVFFFCLSSSWLERIFPIIFTICSSEPVSSSLLLLLLLLHTKTVERHAVPSSVSDKEEIAWTTIWNSWENNEIRPKWMLRETSLWRRRSVLRSLRNHARPLNWLNDWFCQFWWWSTICTIISLLPRLRLDYSLLWPGTNIICTYENVSTLNLIYAEEHYWR